MTRNLDLLTPTNWALAYSISISATITATLAGKNYYAKITPVLPSIIFDKSILAIGINTSVPAGKQWVYGGSIFRFTNSSFGKTFIGERKPLFLGFNLAIFDDFSNDYQIQINIPGWFVSCNLGIYQYEGDTRTVAEQDLAAIKAVIIPGS
ncbi:MAG: hypothetical protein V7K67_16915 [Nostoc sp.]|uniref:hypothetical protein n=1 Tax=Nostoc sp. TaxID=1180 RepID=UPI002FF70734